MLDLDRPLAAAVRASTPAAAWLSPGLHLLFLLAMIGIARHETSPADLTQHLRPSLPLVWVGQGTPGGGGRYADGTTGPPPRAESPGEAPVAVPRPVHRSWIGQQSAEAPLHEMAIPAVPQASGLREIPGTIASIAVSVTSGGGPGTLRGLGTRDGQRVGDGEGYPGMGGPGEGGGNLVPPELLYQVRPNYTPAAMQARVRGVVVMEAVVERDGSVGPVKVVRSLDPTFGLDQEAIRAVRQWRFRAGRRAGTAIPMVVAIELLFELR